MNRSQYRCCSACTRTSRPAIFRRCWTKAHALLLPAVPAHAAPLSGVSLRGALQRLAAAVAVRSLSGGHGAAARDGGTRPGRAVRRRRHGAGAGRRSRHATASARSAPCRIGSSALVGRRPQGRLAHRAGLGERPWCPALADAGIRYVTVDDYHFLCTGKTVEELDGYLQHRGGRPQPRSVSDLRGAALPHSVLSRAPRPSPSSKAWRRAIRGSAAIYFDDIEKFGIWPETYEWVYEKGWLQQFIEGVRRSSGDRAPQHFDEYRAASADARRRLSADHLLHRDERVDAAGRARARLCRPGQAGAGPRPLRARQGLPARRHLAQFPVALQRVELDAQAHAGAVGATRRAAAAQRSTGRLRELLYLAQANDAYWHGLFGGLYLPHLRRAVYNALVELEGRAGPVSAAAGGASSSMPTWTASRSCSFTTRSCKRWFAATADAAVIELDSYSLRHNFGDTLRRREEHYYRKMHVGEHQHFQGEGIASAHDRVSFKHAIAPADIDPDTRPRGLFLDQWRHGDRTARRATSPTSGSPTPGSPTPGQASSSRAVAKGSNSRRPSASATTA